MAVGGMVAAVTSMWCKGAWGMGCAAKGAGLVHGRGVWWMGIRAKSAGGKGVMVRV